jgi:methionyl-tRNA formyltransferase
MSSLRLIMMGTGDFAVPTLRALYTTSHRVVGLYTQPDRTGPGKHKHHMNAMKQLALDHGTPVFQPPNVNLPEELDKLRALEADVFVVAAYGQILSTDLLGIPRLAAINVHASLLPKYRGASPVAYAILKGETETGVSIIQVLPRLDAGPILAVARTPIGPHETAGELEDRLAQLAVPLVPHVLQGIAAGKFEALPQVEGEVTRAPKLKKEMGAIDWQRPAIELDWHVRGMQPWPNAFTYSHISGRPEHRLVVLGVRADPSQTSSAAPGTIVRADNKGLCVQTGGGVLELVRVQPEGKRAMSGEEYLRGHHLQVGDRLGASIAS